MSRPELSGHASSFYNAQEARKYDSSSRMIGVQREITERAIELLRLQPNESAYVLDIGCGSGLSGQVLEEKGHVWVGCDISRDMLMVAKDRMEEQQKHKKQKQQQYNIDLKMDDNSSNDSEGDSDEESDDDNDSKNIESIVPTASGDLIHHDMGCGLPFRPATFDACISISALQWLCYSNSKAQNPKKRLTRFFSSLYVVLKRGGRAVLQFYPETAEQAILISETATKVGFAGGVVVDYPNSAKAKKHYLVLSFDRSAQQKEKVAMAAGLSTSLVPSLEQQQQVTVLGHKGRDNGKARPIRKKKGGAKTKEWILHKKETQRTKGKSVRPDTKYTARKRPTKF